MATNLSPPPYSTPVLSQNGVMSPAWQNWIKQLFVRVGALVAPANSDITTVQSDVSSVKNSTDSQSTSISDLLSRVNALESGLNQGPAL